MNTTAAGKGGSSWLSLAALVSGNFMLIVDVFIVNVALNEIRVELAATEAELQLVVVAYSVAFSALLMNGARLGDRYGRRRLYLVGVAIFMLSSAACGLATTPWGLIVARAVQGTGASLMMPQVYSSLRVLYDGEAQNKAFSILGAAQGLAGIVSQILGGLLILLNPGLGWRLVFLVNIPFALLILMVGRISIPESYSEDRARPDLGGALLGSSAVAMLLVSIMEGRQQEWPSWSLQLLALSFAGLIAFLHYEHRLKRAGGQPILDISTFKTGCFGLGLLAVFLLYSSIGSFSFTLTMLLQAGLKMSPLMAAMIFTPSAIAFFGGALAVPSIVRGSAWKALPYGVAIFGAGLLVSVSSSLAFGFQLYVMLFALVLIGLGQGISVPLALSSVISGLDRKQAGMASGTVSTIQMMGAAFGVAAAGALFFAALKEAGPTITGGQSFVTAFAVGTTYNLAAVAVSLALFASIGRRRDEQHH
ncbi:MFS transporter [Bradyrhizobium liaoningense]|uniref:MFS transporter n=1 Tax=Bradyrhizobium liaoningense TaxID=43992 RepID=UPI0032DE384C